MNTLAIVFSALAFCYAVDPAAEQKTEKESKKWLKNKFQDLSAEEIKELGLTNTLVCGLIKNKEEYVGEPFKHKNRLIENLNFECASQIAEKNPEVFDELFTDTNSTGRQKFFIRIGLDKSCAAKDKFSKVDAKTKKALDDACKDHKPQMDQKPTATASNNTAALVEASIAAVIITSIMVVALA